MFIDFAQPISLPPYWLNHPEVVRSMADNLDQAEPQARLAMPSACPLLLRTDTKPDWWELPIEPVITVNCKNNIVKRSVLKVTGTEQRGTVKELWTQDDYEVSISGILMSRNEHLMPEQDIRRLRGYCEAREPVYVLSDLFTLFNIQRIVIEEYNFPFTHGMQNQMFNIKACSDNIDQKQLFL